MSKKGKKIKLRTSLDVYHRLIHDSTLPINTNNVAIGYTDGRYEEIRHLPLYEWVLIDKGGDIPMHHVVYFKYKDIILWDKRIRLDRLYGSGNTTKSQLLLQVLNENSYNDENISHSPNKQTFEYPPSGKITANPRQETATDAKLTKKGITMISYIYSFGVIGYKFQYIYKELMPLYLVIQHQNNKEWSFPKGRYENGEHCHGYDTAKREFEEESGISFNNNNIKAIDWENPYICHYEYKWRHKLIRKWTVLFAAQLTLTAAPNIIRPKEIGDIKWLSLQQFNRKNKHKEYKNIIAKLNKKLMQQIAADNDNVNKQDYKHEIKEEQKYPDKPVKQSTIYNKQRKSVKDLIGEIDEVINFLSSKLCVEEKEIKPEEEEKDHFGERKQRKKRIKYLMRKNQQNNLWNIFKTKYNYIVPKTINEFKKTFENELNIINISYSKDLNGITIKYDDVYFIFETIFSKRKRDIFPDKIKRTEQKWSEIFEKYPVDNDGYGVSFKYDDEKTWLPLLKKYGLIIISNVLSAQECDKTIDGLFEDMNKRNKSYLRIDRNDSSTWDNKFWPSPKRKFLTDCPAFNKQAFNNRFNKKIQYVFTKIFNTHKLNVSIDNWGFQRPLKTYTANNECVINKKWQYSLQPHWDYSPWLFVQEMKKLKFDAGYQGIIALNDHNMETGCHCNLPCCVNYIETWTKEHIYPYSDKSKYKMYTDENMVYLRKSERPKTNDNIIKYMQNIPMRKGDFIIWHWANLHGNTLNIGDKWRFVQYVRMFPAPCIHPNYAEHDRYAPQRILNNKQFKEILFGDQFYKNMNIFCRQLNLSKTEKCLLGIEEW